MLWVIQFDFLQESPGQWYTAGPIQNLTHYFWSKWATLVVLSTTTGWEATFGDHASRFRCPAGWELIMHIGGNWTKLFWRHLVHVMVFRLHIQSWIRRCGSIRIGVDNHSLMLECGRVLILEEKQELSVQRLLSSDCITHCKRMINHGVRVYGRLFLMFPMFPEQF